MPADELAKYSTYAFLAAYERKQLIWTPVIEGLVLSISKDLKFEF